MHTCRVSNMICKTTRVISLKRNIEWHNTNTKSFEIYILKKYQMSVYIYGLKITHTLVYTALLYTKIHKIHIK